MTFENLPEFEKDLKALQKKYRSLPDDLEIIRLILTAKPDARPPFSFRIDQLGLKTCVIKVKKIACRSLKGKGVNTGLRLVYAHFELDDRIVFVEIYHKQEQEMENRARIMANFK